jgi:hypothetical protein
MDWSLADAALLFGAFLLALLPVALFALKRQRPPQDGAQAGRYRCGWLRGKEQDRG